MRNFGVKGGTIDLWIKNLVVEEKKKKRIKVVNKTDKSRPRYVKRGNGSAAIVHEFFKVKSKDMGK